MINSLVFVATQIERLSRSVQLMLAGAWAISLFLLTQHSLAQNTQLVHRGIEPTAPVAIELLPTQPQQTAVCTLDHSKPDNLQLSCH